MNNYFVILAAGKSKRFQSKIAKQFYHYKNKEIIDHSIEKSLNSKLFKKVVIVTNKLSHFKKKKLPKSVKIIKGGKERSDSSLIALKYLKKGKKFDVIIIKQTIHFFSKTKIVSLLNLAKKNLNKRGTLLILSLNTSS